MRLIRIGLLLGWRQIQRANKWTTLLIIFVMMLTFLNLIAVSGVLVGLITGAERAVRAEALGDIILSERDDEDRIIETETILRELSAYPEIESYSVRYIGGGELEANYKERRSLTAERDIASVSVTGIDPSLEDHMSNLSLSIRDGEYLDPNEEGYILIGYYYLEEFAEQFGDIFDTISNVKPGDTVRLTVGEISKEFIVKGIVASKVDQVSLNTYIPNVNSVVSLVALIATPIRSSFVSNRVNLSQSSKQHLSRTAWKDLPRCKPTRKENQNSSLTSRTP